MTDVAFHFGAPDKLAYVCRLLRKALATDARVLVVGDVQTVSQLDADLWALSPTDFVAHCLESASLPERNHSPILLATQVSATSGRRYPVLVNLMATVAQGFEAFGRVIEVVSTDEADRAMARHRWKHYTERGYAITRHDLNLRGAR